MSKPVVIHLINQLEIGGTELSLVTLLPHMQNIFDNQVCCMGPVGPLHKDLEDEGILVHTLGSSNRFDLRLIRQVRLLLLTTKAKAIVTYLPQADMIGRLAARRTGIPVISAQRSSYHRRPYLRLPDRLTRPLVTEYVVQTGLAKRKFPATDTTVIPNAVRANDDEQRDSARALLHLGPNDIGITCVSNLRAGKGHITLLAALALLPMNIAWNCFLVGEGPEQPRVEQQIIGLGLSQRVRLLGRRRDVAHILAGSDIFVFPSLAEGMSNALLEALAAGLPVVASDIAANKAVITHDRNGLLAAAGDAADFSKQLLRLLTSVETRTTLARAAEAHVRKHHAPTVIASKWEAVLERVTTL